MSHKHLMPLRTRLFTEVWSRVGREDQLSWTPEQIALQRQQVVPARAPFSWVTGAVPSGVTVRTSDVPMRDGSTVPARIVRTAAAGPGAPVVLYLHGGGWTLSNPANYDPLTGHLAKELGAVVVAPDYRKAPQAKAPQAVFDAYDVLTWIGQHPEQVAASGPIAVAGDSAGGNLAAVISILSRDEGGPRLAGQALIYPAVDLTKSQPSAHWRDEPILSGDSMDWFKAGYLQGMDPRDPLVSPLFAASHADLPPCLVQTAECDPLVDEGELYARTLQEAGVPTRMTRYVGMPHGFMSFPRITPVGRQARAELVERLRAWFAGEA